MSGSRFQQAKELASIIARLGELESRVEKIAKGALLLIESIEEEVMPVVRRMKTHPSVLVPQLPGQPPVGDIDDA
jgi:hypothetical protein